MIERHSDAIPRLALSVRQPWAFAIVAGWKDVENRSWKRPNPGLNFRGPFAIHAARGMTRYEYESAAEFMARIGFSCPPPAELLRGGIVGMATINDIVSDLDSPWFFGSRGLVVTDAAEIDFIPCGGRLGFFDWRELLQYAKGEGAVPPARWMLPQSTKPKTAAPKQGTLL